MASVKKTSGLSWTIQSLQMRMDIDRAYIDSMNHTILRFLPMIMDKSIDRDYRHVIQERIDTWRKLAHDTEEHFRTLENALQKHMSSSVLV